MNPVVTGIVGLVVLLLALIAGIPVGISMIIVGLAGFGYLVSVGAALNLLSIELLATFSAYSFAVVCAFTVMGSLAGYTGVSGRLYDSAHKWFGRLPGGLALATTGACALFGAICGSAGAAAATFGRVALPEMRKHNYSMALACGCIACGGTLSILIPPSLVFIIYGIVASQSVGLLFISGIVPGIVATALIMISILILCLKNPTLGPPGKAANFREKVMSLPKVLESLALFIVILGGIFLGIFTPVEGGAVGAIGIIIIALVRRMLTWKGVVESFRDTAQLTGMVFMIITGGFIFGRFIAASNIASALTEWMVSLHWSPKLTFIVFMIPIYFLAGCFMEMLAVVIISVPLFLPLMMRLGFDPIWFGVEIVLLTMVGLLTPPVGMSCYTVKAVAPDIPLSVIFRGAIWLVPALLVTSLLVLFFPDIALWLPRMMSK
jgi:C4-dicarboxylate transporter DctM subunit